MVPKYVNPYTDFGFKKIFGEEASKDALISFLNSFLPEEDQIMELDFHNTEHWNRTELERKAIFDLYCKNEKGEYFIVELQRAYQNYFKDRMLYYATFPIQEQAEKGSWNYQLKAIYCVGILSFSFPTEEYANSKDVNEVVHIVKLKNQHNRVFYDKLTFIYLELPKFKKSEKELKNEADRWLYFIQHIEDFREIPRIFKGTVFEDVLNRVEIARYTDAEHLAYQASLKTLRDNTNTFNYAVETALSQGLEAGLEQGREQGLEVGLKQGLQKGLQQGREQGLEQGLQQGLKQGLEKGREEGVYQEKLRTAQELKSLGIPIEKIRVITGLTLEEF